MVKTSTVNKVKKPTFFEKNMKWFALGLLILFVFKSFQGCTRNMSSRALEKEYHLTIDSLIKNLDILSDTVKLYRSENKMLKVLLLEKAKQVEGNQSALVKALERNTTIINNIKQDTTRK